MVRWFAHAIVKIILASAVIWFATAVFENGLEPTLTMVSNVASALITAAALDWSLWPVILATGVLTVIGMVIYDTVTRD